jgi:hypothetical protein
MQHWWATRTASEEVDVTDERDPDELIEEEELENPDESFLDEPPEGPHGEPGIPRIEPLPGPIDVPPVPGQRREKPLD